MKSARERAISELMRIGTQMSNVCAELYWSLEDDAERARMNDLHGRWTAAVATFPDLPKTKRRKGRTP